MMQRSLRQRCGALAALGLLALTSACAKRPEFPVTVAEPRPYEWSKETLAIAGELPVQELGRVKPLSTVAAFSLLKINGKRKYTLPEESGLPTAGERLNPTGWLLDVLFFPEQAAKYEVFLVEDSGVLEAVGLEFPDRKRRDRYSYDQLRPARNEILGAARAAHGRDEKQRTSIERQSLDLNQRMAEFESLIGTLDYARLPVPPDVPADLRAALGDELREGRMSATALLTKLEVLAPLLERLRAGDPATQAAMQRFEGALQTGLDTVSRMTEGTLHLVAPERSRAQREEWDAPGDVLAGLAVGEEPRLRQIAVLASCADALRTRADEAAFVGHLRAARDGAVALATERNEYGKIALERTFYRINFFYNALAIFLLAFVIATVSWLKPDKAWLSRAVWWTTAVGCALVIAGVTFRCVLRERPPVSTLYETILFISGTGVLAALVLDKLVRMPLAATLGAFLGATGMFMANRYELQEAVTAGDTMGTLQAVLDTNFWLATHVTSVTLGYSAGLFAALIAHVWLGARFLGLHKGNARWYRQVGRAVYGVIAFGLLFSVVGTILGGIWANDSWGRFWGWDPKENGALMICLFELCIVHARLGGYLKDFGVCVLAVLLGPVVAFSWWHVNLLGVGLHSYGFTAGIKEYLFAYYALELSVALAALSWWALGGRALLAHRPSAATAPSAPATSGPFAD